MAKTINKSSLIESLRRTNSLTVKDATAVVDTVFGTIESALKRGDDVRLIGFGSFKVVSRAERKGRNPQTGEAIKIKARKAVTFKAGSDLKSSVN